MLKDRLLDLGNFRLLLGAEPTTGEQIGLRSGEGVIRGLIRKDIEALPFDEKTLTLVEDLIRYLQRGTVLVRLYDRGFLHAKCWLFYSDLPVQLKLFDRFKPIVAIVGSSNFTGPGLTSNRELNLAHKVLLDASEVDDPDVVLVDESHNFRNRNAQRYANIELVLGANGGRGRDGGRKKVILLTATPINNDLFDLYNQPSLVTHGDRIDEEEQFTELASSEFLSQQLRNFFEAGGREMLDSLPDGIHSGLARQGARGVFFYFQADAQSLLAAIEDLRRQMGSAESGRNDSDSKLQTALRREDLRLICFEFVAGG